MSIRNLHEDPRIFADPTSFKPERWLVSDRKELQKYFHPFGRGARNCLGMPLAWAELYTMLGNAFRRFDMRLHDTTIEDIKLYHDYVSPFAHFDSKGVWATVETDEAA
jgi:cytochrome P450